MKPKPQIGSTWARRNRRKADPLSPAKPEEVLVVVDPKPDAVTLRDAQGKLRETRAEKFLDLYEPQGRHQQHPCLCQRLTDRHEPNLENWLRQAVDLLECRDGIRIEADSEGTQTLDDPEQVLNGLSCKVAIRSLQARRLVNACQQFLELSLTGWNPQIVVYPGDKEDA